MSVLVYEFKVQTVTKLWNSGKKPVRPFLLGWVRQPNLGSLPLPSKLLESLLPRAEKAPASDFEFLPLRLLSAPPRVVRPARPLIRSNLSNRCRVRREIWDSRWQSAA